MVCRVGIFAVSEMIINPGPCQSRTFEIQCDGILAKRQIFRRSSAVEQVTVNHLVTGSNPVVGAVLENWSKQAPVFLYPSGFLEVRTFPKSLLPAVRFFSVAISDLRLQSGTICTLCRGSNLSR